MNTSIVHLQRKPWQIKLLKRWCGCLYLIFPFMMNILQIKAQVHLSSGIYIFTYAYKCVCRYREGENTEIKVYKHLPSKSNCHFLQGLWSAFILWNSLFWRIQWGNPLWKSLVLINARGKRIYSGKNEDIKMYQYIISQNLHGALVPEVGTTCPLQNLISPWSEGLQ